MRSLPLFLVIFAASVSRASLLPLAPRCLTDIDGAAPAVQARRAAELAVRLSDLTHAVSEARGHGVPTVNPFLGGVRRAEGIAARVPDSDVLGALLGELRRVRHLLVVAEARAGARAVLARFPTRRPPEGVAVETWYRHLADAVAGALYERLRGGHPAPHEALSGGQAEGLVRAAEWRVHASGGAPVAEEERRGRALETEKEDFKAEWLRLRAGNGERFAVLEARRLEIDESLRRLDETVEARRRELREAAGPFPTREAAVATLFPQPFADGAALQRAMASLDPQPHCCHGRCWTCPFAMRRAGGGRVVDPATVEPPELSTLYEARAWLAAAFGE